MAALTFVKLGGSIITDKRGHEAANLPVLTRLAGELGRARSARPDERLLLGHGSGSFGHVYAQRYGVHRGVSDAAGWLGFALTARAARALNTLVVDALLAAEVPALALSPRGALQSSQGQLTAWASEAISAISSALANGMLPVIHGDVAFDSAQGSAIISTEMLFDYLARHTTLQPTRVILVGETIVYTADPHIDPMAEPIPLITRANISEVLEQVDLSDAVDVTGGMRSKIEGMWQLVEALPTLEIHLITAAAGLLERALLGQANNEGTHIRMNESG